MSSSEGPRAAAAHDASAYTLYSEPSSPFSAPVRVALYAKGVEITILPPPGGLKSAVYNSINPVGTIPCLVRADGFMLPESTAILEYLDDVFPEVPLRPQTPEERARVRLMQRVAELGVTRACASLAQVAGSQERDAAMVSLFLTRLVRGLASVRVFLSGERWAAGSAFTLADCQLAPALFGVPAVVRAFGTGDLIAAYPELTAYVGACREHPAVARVLDEMAQAGA